MKIYTKTGDRGETGLFGGSRVPKDHLRISAYGTLDELCSVLGIVLAEPDLPTVLSDRLVRVQSEIFQLGAELATQGGKKPGTALVADSETAALEHEIDEMESKLPALKHFILPGGTRAAALLQFARAVHRRAEREAIRLHHLEPLRAEVLSYMNRLSDYLFVCARMANHLAGKPETEWVAPKWQP